MHPLLRNISLDTWQSEHHCCVSCSRATQKSVSANFRSLSEEKFPTKCCGLLQLIKATRPVSVTCVLLEVFLLALGSSVPSLVAPFCAAAVGWGLLARIIETSVLSQHPSLDIVSHQSLHRVWGQAGGSGTSFFGCCCQFCANKVGLDMTGSGREP